MSTGASPSITALPLDQADRVQADPGLFGVDGSDRADLGGDFIADAPPAGEEPEILGDVDRAVATGRVSPSTADI